MEFYYIILSVLMFTTMYHVTTVSSLNPPKLASVEMSLEKKLIKNLLTDYAERGRNGRPVAGDNETLKVHYGLSLIQLLDLDERNQVLTTNVWATYGWEDVYLTWNPADYGNITKVRVPKETVWQPDVKLYNYADERLEEKRDALIVIQYDGQIVWIPQAIFKSSCSIDIRHFPFDAQTCKMKFGSWTYDGSKIELELLYNIDSGFEFSDYVPSNEWTIVSSSAKKNVIKYACCPGEPFIDLTFELQIRRQPAFYNYILILPCILLSSLTLVLFWLPPESPAKMQLGMNIFVAFFVLLLLLAESTPPASSSIPLIGAYYCLNMVLITLSTFLSVIVVNLYFHTAKSEVPYIVRKEVYMRFTDLRKVMFTDAEGGGEHHVSKIMIDWFARLFCMRYQGDEHYEKKKLRKQPKLINNDRVYGEPTHDRVMYTEMSTDESWRMGTCRGTPGQGTDHATTNNVPCEYNTTNMSPGIHVNINIENDIKEIRSCLDKMMRKQKQKEVNERIMREWKLVAVVLDRLFFFTYLLVIIVSILTVFDFVLFNSIQRYD